MSPAKPIRKYIHLCLNSTPAVLQALVGSLPADSDFWDFRSDPERFSAREVLAHLADWNPIFQSRLSLTLAEDHPTLPRIDEERLPIEHGYATQDPLDALRRFCSSRETLVEMVAAFDDEDWERVARREDMGDVTMADIVVLVAIHDAYHGRQIAEYLEGWRKG